jgi:RNA polymerase sigma-70 factor, ECF subfamily
VRIFLRILAGNGSRNRSACAVDAIKHIKWVASFHGKDYDLIMISPQFINECLSGSENAIQSLVRAHQRGVFQIALTILDDGSAPESETIAQAETATRDTFVRALDRLGRYREDTPFTIWLYTIAIEVSRRRARRWRVARFLGLIFQPRLGKTEKDWLSGVEDKAMLVDTGSPLFQAVRGMEEKLRLPVVLRYYHDYSAAEIARLLRTGEGAVHARLDAAREKIAKLPQQQDHND